MKNKYNIWVQLVRLYFTYFKYGQYLGVVFTSLKYVQKVIIFWGAGQVAMPGGGAYNAILNILHYFSIVNLDTHIGQHWE